MEKINLLRGFSLSPKHNLGEMISIHNFYLENTQRKINFKIIIHLKDIRFLHILSNFDQF